MSITLQSEDQVYIFSMSIKVFHRLWFDNPKKGKAAVSAQGGFAVFRCTQMRGDQRRPQSTLAQGEKPGRASRNAGGRGRLELIRFTRLIPRYQLKPFIFTLADLRQRRALRRRFRVRLSC
jgi:hypothetical protein